MKRIKRNVESLVASYLYDNQEYLKSSGCSTIAEYLKNDLNQDGDYWWFLESDTDFYKDAILTEEDRKMVEEWIDANYNIKIYTEF